jgi:uncharacterized PurR-regulated membrane protein YhhQ (DUF165 family)
VKGAACIALAGKPNSATAVTNSSFQVILTMIGSQILIKLGCEILLIPLITLLIAFLKKRENINYFDNKTDFNPFK